jgi:hypothetical protein
MSSGELQQYVPRFLLRRCADPTSRRVYVFDNLTSASELSKWHREQVTRYPLLQGYAIPRPLIVREILEKLIAAVYTEIWGRDVYEHDRASEHGHGLSLDSSLYSASS